MAFEVSFAQPRDAPRIAEIHMAAFGSNRLLWAQFPTEKARQDLQVSIERKALGDIQCKNVTVLVVKETQPNSGSGVEVNRESEDGKAAGSSEHDTGGGDVIISFAKWSHPVKTAADDDEPPWEYPPDTDWGVLNKWTELMDSAQDRLLRSEPCYKLSYIGTHPLHQKRGAASSLVQWAIERCNKENRMAYLEGTLEARRLYDKHGFIGAESVTMDLEPIPGTNVGGPYSETCFVYRPPNLQ